jgi:hypothetical protein
MNRTLRGLQVAYYGETTAGRLLAVIVTPRLRTGDHGVREMRRVQEVEGLKAELQPVPLFDIEFARHGKVRVHGPRPAHRVEAGVSEA